MHGPRHRHKHGQRYMLREGGTHTAHGAPPTHRHRHRHRHRHTIISNARRPFLWLSISRVHRTGAEYRSSDLVSHNSGTWFMATWFMPSSLMVHGFDAHGADVPELCCDIFLHTHSTHTAPWCARHNTRFPALTFVTFVIIGITAPMPKWSLSMTKMLPHPPAPSREQRPCERCCFRNFLKHVLLCPF